MEFLCQRWPGIEFWIRTRRQPRTRTWIWSLAILKCQFYLPSRSLRQSPLLRHSRLTLRNVDDRMAGKYRCSAKNRLGSVQSDFQLLIRGRIEETILKGVSSSLRCLFNQARSIGDAFRKVKQYASIRASLSLAKVKAVKHYNTIGEII